MLTRSTIVAIVDDDVSVLTGLRRFLMSYGLQVSMFTSAEQYLEAADTTEATCLVLDINLPGGMSGLDLGRAITSSDNPIPIIFMTGTPDRTMRKQAQAVGCVEFLEKPFAGETLIDAILKATCRVPG